MILLERAAPPRALVGEVPELDERALAWCRPTSAALVLGSAQRAEEFDLAGIASAGLEVVRRRSGGSAVVVAPGAQLWADFFVPAHDPLHLADVRRAPEVIGEVWAEALVACGVAPDELAVHRGALVPRRYSDRCCFLGLGPGEVLLGGRKCVGLAQRRTRRGSWFFTMALRRVDAERAAELFAATAQDRRPLARALAAEVAPLPELAHLETELVEAFSHK